MALSFSSVRSLGDELFWIEGRPELAGRRVVLRLGPGGDPVVISPTGLSLSSRVHEYGGGEFAVREHEGAEVLGVRADQALVAFRPGAEEVRVLLEATEGVARGDLRCAGPLLSFVQEEHVRGAVERSIRVLDLEHGAERVLVSGRSFYAGARLSDDRRRLVYACWDHPQMPWEASEVWVASLDESLVTSEERHLAGGLRSAASHPTFVADGSIALLAEHEGWTRPLLIAPDGSSEVLGADEVEHGGPIWSLGEDLLVEVDERLFAVAQRGGVSEVVEVSGRASRPVEVAATARITLASLEHALGWIGATPASLGAVGRLALGDGASSMLPLGPSTPLAPDQIARAEPMEARGVDGRSIFALLYRPRNGSLRGPDGERPPVVVVCHGGPTAQASARFDPLIELLSSRGFCVVAPNYAGSTGFGAAYRRRLEGAWGVADVADCVELVGWLAAEGIVDGERAAIRGSSAGGLTALLAATTGAFVATVSWYGVADLTTLVATTHDFEAHYVDALVGTLPEAAARYAERSPVNRAGEISGAVLLLQGSDDRVVPPDQAASMAAALSAAGREVTLLSFAGEGHGFRRLDTLVEAYRAELAFYERHLCRGAHHGGL
jgi:acetyl esterase/lipase